MARTPRLVLLRDRGSHTRMVMAPCAIALRGQEIGESESESLMRDGVDDVQTRTGDLRDCGCSSLMRSAFQPITSALRFFEAGSIPLATASPSAIDAFISSPAFRFAFVFEPSEAPLR